MQILVLDLQGKWFGATENRRKLLFRPLSPIRSLPLSAAEALDASLRPPSVPQKVRIKPYDQNRPLQDSRGPLSEIKLPKNSQQGLARPSGLKCQTSVQNVPKFPKWYKNDANQHSSGTNFRTGDFAPPEPEFRAEFWETNFGRPNFGPEFRGRIVWLCFFQQKRPPENPQEIHLQKFTFQNSTQKSGQKIHIAPLQGRLAEYHYTENDYRTELYYFRIIFGNFCSVITEPNCFWN